jgi:hypothetical protein
MVQALSANGGCISILIVGFTNTWGFPKVMLINFGTQGDEGSFKLIPRLIHLRCHNPEWKELNYRTD